MKKRILSLVIIALIFVTSGCADKTNTTNTVGTDTGITSRMENTIELQKNFFVGEVTAVTTKDALISKYSIDITTYTVYTVNVTDSLDGFTPLGEIQLYCVGTTENFTSRISLKKNETYILDAQPWVYGDKIIYLLPIYTTAYPRIDTTGHVTLAASSTEVLDCGTKESYIQDYTDVKTDYAKAYPDFFTPAKTLSRFTQIVTEIYEKNSADWKRDNLKYAWTPSEALIQTTRNKTKELYNKITALDPSTVTNDDIISLFK